ncbi:MAG: chromosome partitioning protein ParA [Lachnospiraceae bacterium]|nr:chromosome partitioning protein ParA [Lachnospiraceae bacterium]
MKIKLAILEKDSVYLNRLVAAFNVKYADAFEIYSFTEKQNAVSALDERKIDILLSSDNFDFENEAIPKRCTLAYLVDSTDIESYNEHRAIGKFQRIDLIYKQILSIYSENAKNISLAVLGDDKTKVISFQSVSGGCGGSTMAAACAIHFAAAGKKTLYLNLEKFGVSDSFFAAEGQFDLSDIIFYLKSKKSNLALKLESCVKQDPRGVFFYSDCKVALDKMELGTDDILLLITELKLTGTYDVIVLDLDFSLAKDGMSILNRSNAVVWVGDGSKISNLKLFRKIEMLKIMEENVEMPVYKRLSIAYNKFSNKTSEMLEGLDVRVLGGAQRFEHATTEMILGQLAPMGMFDPLIQQ